MLRLRLSRQFRAQAMSDEHGYDRRLSNYPDRSGSSAEASRTLDACSNVGQSLKMQIASTGNKGTALELPPAAAALLKTMLKEMAAGRAVTLSMALMCVRNTCIEDIHADISAFSQASDFPT